MAQFDEGDPAYEWLVIFLTELDVWKVSREFIVTAKSSKRKWAVTSGPGAAIRGNAEYVPSFGAPQLFRWKGYWVEITRQKDTQMAPYGNYNTLQSLHLIIYTRDLNALSALVEEARLRYCETSRRHVAVHSVDGPTFGPGPVWNNIQAKVRRALDSLVLEEGCIESIINDANDFLDMEDWYVDSGIPHRRGYLLHGPPGTGKTSTVYAIAGELGLEIYTLSLASNFIDDAFLQRAVSSLPKHSLLLIEDIDCAFPSRDEDEDTQDAHSSMYRGGHPFMVPHGSKVTMSGLLNVLDGVNSQDGTLFFATTNHIDRLDAALIRPGRIDKQIAYKLATRNQSDALFRRFYSQARGAHKGGTDQKTRNNAIEIDRSISNHARVFANDIPEEKFSTAEILGYLLNFKKQPVEAARDVTAWVAKELKGRSDREEREALRKAKIRSSRAVTASELVIPIPQSQGTRLEEESDVSSAVSQNSESPVISTNQQCILS
ncbi:hypothetical protein HWV62_41082 [Athelia sp. TMB]|nr:hypothetical protein HWV62_41082 [Athelia sp. TMB]